MARQHVVLSVSRYQFRNDFGEVVQGTKVTYLEEGGWESNRRGPAVLQIGAPIELWDKFSNLPGVYDLDFRQRPDGRGKPVLVLVDVQFDASKYVHLLNDSGSSILDEKDVEKLKQVSANKTGNKEDAFVASPRA